MALLSNSSLNPCANGRNIVGCYILRLSAHPVACCCVLLGVVAQSLKTVKLLANNSQLLRPFASGKECCVRLHGA